MGTQVLGNAFRKFLGKMSMYKNISNEHHIRSPRLTVNGSLSNCFHYGPLLYNTFLYQSIFNTPAFMHRDTHTHIADKTPFAQSLYVSPFSRSSCQKCPSDTVDPPRCRWSGRDWYHRQSCDSTNGAKSLSAAKLLLSSPSINVPFWPPLMWWIAFRATFALWTPNHPHIGTYKRKNYFG